MRDTSTACQAVTARGAPCAAPALRGSAWCFQHDPARAVERLAARSRGGRARHGRNLGTTAEQAEPLQVRTTADIVALLESEIATVRGLERSLNRARVVGYLALAALKAHEQNELADRVAAIELALKARDR